MAETLRASWSQLTHAPDVVLCSWLFPDACAVAKLAQDRNLPFVAIAQGSDVHQYLKMPARRRAILDMATAAKGIITRSADLARLLRETGAAGEKLHTIYNGVDLDLFAPGDKASARASLGISTKEQVILYVGNFYDVKNPLLLVRAHSQITRRRKNVRLLMVGGGPLEADCRKASSEGVIFAGRKTAPEVAQLMRAADVLCVPSRNEGVPNVILEAFASGLPVVAFKVGGIPEVHTSDTLGRLVKPGDENALACGIEEAFDAPANSALIREHGSKFSWPHAAAQYHEVLSSPE